MKPLRWKRRKSINSTAFRISHTIVFGRSCWSRLSLKITLHIKANDEQCHRHATVRIWSPAFQAEDFISERTIWCSHLKSFVDSFHENRSSIFTTGFILYIQTSKIMWTQTSFGIGPASRYEWTTNTCMYVLKHRFAWFILARIALFTFGFRAQFRTELGRPHPCVPLVSRRCREALTTFVIKVINFYDICRTSQPFRKYDKRREREKCRDVTNQVAESNINVSEDGAQQCYTKISIEHVRHVRRSDRSSLCLTRFVHWIRSLSAGWTRPAQRQQMFVGQKHSCFFDMTTLCTTQHK